MIDTSPSGSTEPRKVDYRSAEARERVQKRYRAEAWFKLSGLMAILLSGFFVVMLLGNIFFAGFPAFFEYSANLSVFFDASVIDPKGNREAENLKQADYQRLAYDALRVEFPQVTSKAQRRKLERLISTGAGDDLRAFVFAKPDQIGQKTRLPILLSAEADHFLKSASAETERHKGVGKMSIHRVGTSIVLTGENQAFMPFLRRIKWKIQDRARVVEKELRGFEERMSDATSRQEHTAPLEAELVTLKQRLASYDKSEKIDPASMPAFLVAVNGGLIRLEEIGQEEARGEVLVPPAGGGGFDKKTEVNQWAILELKQPEANRKLNDFDIAWLETLRQRGVLQKTWAWRFFKNGDSREPELAGIRGALVGSAFTLFVTLLFCLPIGVAAAIYLEEFASKNRLTDFLEVNINNLAAVPSIIFGLLGLAIFLNFFGMPRSAPLVGGLVLALLVLPTIIIAARAALKSVPPSIKQAALGLGASHQQAVFHHVLPLAMPGIMTGTIIGMAHALGETAPLLMIGMVAFIVDVPQSLIDPATALPVQIFLWADLPELAFRAKTAAAIIVLLVFLIIMNGLSILVRRRFEQRW